MIESIVLASAIYLQDCPVKEAQEQYNYFYNNTYENTGINTKGEKTANVKSVTKEQANISWACLNDSANNGNCSALYTLHLFYKTGALSTIFGYSKNQELSEKYAGKYKLSCGDKNA